MDYCVPLGIPHSVFTGRVVGPGDPMWLPTDLGYALAWQANKAATCPGCGTRADEWAAEEHAYYSDSVKCEGCARIAEEHNNVPRDGDQPRPGYHVFLRPDLPPLPDFRPPDHD